jgi:uncharacterized protein YjbJ (UPF0337 family)
MKRKLLQKKWREMRGRFSEWWDDLTDEDLNRIAGNQERLFKVLQEHYGYTRNLAIKEVESWRASYHSDGKGRKKRSNKDMGTLQYSSDGNDD